MTAKFLIVTQRLIAPLTDSRVKLMTEILTGIRVLKFFAWEPPFLEKVEDIRKQEMAQVLRRSKLNAIVTTLAFAVPVMVGALAFILFGISQELEADKLFAALTWFGQLRYLLIVPYFRSKCFNLINFFAI
jgi:ATP-binding cassette, subfamily C (CFTR/MRP), member 2